jgi:ubiquinol-cytochrome c reductase cytochrome c1 subunit
MSNLFFPISVFGYFFYRKNKQQKTDCWIYRDDIGAWWGIKGYEEQVTEVGSHKGFNDWSAFRFLSTYDAASV